jgi:hypothetical protein
MPTSSSFRQDAGFRFAAMCQSLASCITHFLVICIDRQLLPARAPYTYRPTYVCDLTRTYVFRYHASWIFDRLGLSEILSTPPFHRIDVRSYSYELWGSE